MGKWDIVSWLANIGFIISAILIGKKKKSGFIFGAFGNSTYAIKALIPGHFDPALSFICFVFSAIQLYNWFKWCGEEKNNITKAA